LTIAKLYSQNLGNFSSTTFDVDVEKIIHGRALVLVDGKWYARLNHYDYGRSAA